MSMQNHNGTRVDDLLKKACADDLPAEVAAGMRERIRRFRMERPEDEGRSGVRSLLFHRAVWAALSILMLIAGILLQGAKSSSPLADRISALKAEFSSVSTIRR